MENQLSIFDDIYNIKDNITDGQFLILNNKISSIIQENRRLIEVNRKRTQKKCNCSTKWIFNDKDEMPTWFCLESLEKMKNCENFQKLIRKVPLLENLFHRIDLPFTEEAINGDSNDTETAIIIKILTSLHGNVVISSKRNKIIVSLVCFDFTIRNAKFIKNVLNPQVLIETMSRKLKAFSDDPVFLQIALEFNVNVTKWIDILDNL